MGRIEVRKGGDSREFKLLLSEHDVSMPPGGNALEPAARPGAAEIAHTFGGTVVREGYQKDCFIFTDSVIRCPLHEEAIS